MSFSPWLQFWCTVKLLNSISITKLLPMCIKLEGVFQKWTMLLSVFLLQLTESGHRGHKPVQVVVLHVELASKISEEHVQTQLH